MEFTIHRAELRPGELPEEGSSRERQAPDQLAHQSAGNNAFFQVGRNQMRPFQAPPHPPTPPPHDGENAQVAAVRGGLGETHQALKNHLIA